MKRSRLRLLVHIPLILAAALALLPIIYTASNAFMPPEEISAGGAFHLLPDRLSLSAFYDVLVARPEFLNRFWVSLSLTSVIVAGQLIVACLAGYGFAKFRFPLRGPVFFTFIVLMLMPLQVTLVPSFMVLDRLGLLGTYAAVALPGIFMPFAVVLMQRVISGVPDELLQASRLDGAGQLRTLLSIVFPLCRAGLVSVGLLVFIDNWNMVEQPLVFLRDPEKYPLSVFLAQINSDAPGLAFACGLLSMLPTVLLFFAFEEELVTGIEYASLK